MSVFLTQNREPIKFSQALPTPTPLHSSLLHTPQKYFTFDSTLGHFIVSSWASINFDCFARRPLHNRLVASLILNLPLQRSIWNSTTGHLGAPDIHKCLRLSRTKLSHFRIAWRAQIYFYYQYGSSHTHT